MVLRFSHHQKLVQANNEKEVMDIKLNYVYMQNGTTFYLLSLVDHSWTMGLNFGSTVLNQLNLIKAIRNNIFISKSTSKFASQV
jgi:hypothetical protein